MPNQDIIYERSRTKRKYNNIEIECANRLNLCTANRDKHTGTIVRVCRCTYDIDLIRATKGTWHNCDCGEKICRYVAEVMLQKVTIHNKQPRRVSIY